MAARWALGVTGDVGSGKSTVRGWLADRGAAALDADAVVHEVLSSDAEVIAAVAARFGGCVLAEGGGIDRSRVASVVFADPRAMRDLEAIVHPAVAVVVGGWLDRCRAGVAVVEAVKLLEGGLRSRVDTMWLVVCDRAERRRRLMRRGWSSAEVDRRMAAATPLGPRLALADVVIDNSGTVAATEAQLDVAWQRIATLATRGGRR